MKDTLDKLKKKAEFDVKYWAEELKRASCAVEKIYDHPDYIASGLEVLEQMHCQMQAKLAALESKLEVSDGLVKQFDQRICEQLETIQSLKSDRAAKVAAKNTEIDNLNEKLQALEAVAEELARTAGHLNKYASEVMEKPAADWYSLRRAIAASCGALAAWDEYRGSR